MKRKILFGGNLASLLVLGFAQEDPGDTAPTSLLAEEPGLQGPTEEGSGFREIGAYRVKTGTLLKLGKATEVAKGEMLFRVFMDGIDVRLSPDGADESYISFQIYRAGGIYDQTGENLLSGVQAFSDQGEIVRHLCVEPNLLTLTKFPTSSSDIEVIYALREK